MSFATAAGCVVMIVCTVAANLWLKLGAMQPPASRIFFGAIGWQSAAGLATFGLSGLAYAIVLRHLPLSVAQVITAAQFLGVTLAARLLLQEPISPLRWAGLVITCVGVIITGATANE